MKIYSKFIICKNNYFYEAFLTIGKMYEIFYQNDKYIDAVFINYMGEESEFVENLFYNTYEMRIYLIDGILSE